MNSLLEHPRARRIITGSKEDEVPSQVAFSKYEIHMREMN
jgi:hypothetical protein